MECLETGSFNVSHTSLGKGCSSSCLKNSKQVEARWGNSEIGRVSALQSMLLVFLRLHLYTRRSAQVEGFGCRCSHGNAFKRNIGTIKGNVKLYQHRGQHYLDAFKISFSVCAGLACHANKWLLHLGSRVYF